MEHGTYIAVDSVPEKTSGPGQETEEEDEESMDWWTKYHASLDTLIEVNHFCMVLIGMLALFK